MHFGNSANEPSAENQPGSQPTGHTSAQPIPVRTIPKFGRGLDALPPAAPMPLTPIALLVAFRRRWVLATNLGLAIAVVAAVIAWLVTPSGYSGRTLLHVSTNIPYYIHKDVENRGDFGTYQRTQVAMVKGRQVLNAALNDPKVRDLTVIKREIEPVAWLEKKVQADFGYAPEILRISISGLEPEELKPLLDAVRDAYMSKVVEWDHNQRRSKLDKLKSLHADYDLKLREKRKTLKVLSGELGSRHAEHLKLKQAALFKELNMVQAELMQLDMYMRKLNLEVPPQLVSEKKPKEIQGIFTTVADLLVTGVQNQAGTSWLLTLHSYRYSKNSEETIYVPQWQVEELLQKDMEVQKYAKRVADREKELADLKSSISDYEKEPAVKRAATKVADAKESEATFLKGARKRLIQKLSELERTKRNSRRGPPNYNNGWFAVYRKVLSDQVADRTEKLLAFNQKKEDLQWLIDEILHVEDTTKTIGHQVQSIEVELGAPLRVRVLPDETVIDNNNSSPLRVAGLVFLGVFLAGVAGVTWLEFLARRVGSGEEVTRGLRLGIMGTMPLLTGQARRMLASGNTKDRQWHRRFAASVDSTRTMVVHAARQESMRVIMVTSALGGEGKTMLSCHLAINLARAGHRTLLIDADLRRPAVHKLLNLPAQAGLSEVLRGEAPVNELIIPGPVDKLGVLAAGNSYEQASLLLGQACVGDLLEQLKEYYDFILVDSAPVLPVADTQLIGQHVDGVILSILRDVSRLAPLYTTYERLLTLKIRVLGAVFHGTMNSSYEGTYHYAKVPQQPAKV